MIFIARVLCSRRHHADYGVGLRVESDLAAQNVRRGFELRAPQPVAEDHLQRIAWDLRLLVELASQLRVQTKHVEVTGGDSESVEPLGFAGVAGELPVSARKRSQ